MKKTFLLGHILLCALISPTFSQEVASSASGSAYSMLNSGDQEVTATTSLAEVLNAFQLKYKISILYRSELIKDKVVKNPNFNGSVEEALLSILKPIGLKFKNPKSSLYIIIKDSDSKESKSPGSRSLNDISGDYAAGNSDLQPLNARVQKTVEFPVKGRVTGEGNDGLPGVSVVVKGTTIGTATDASGSYSLNVPDANSTLVFSYIGYTNQEVPINSRSTIDITLKMDVEALQEIVVVGYGTQKRTSVTGAVATISAKEVTALPVPSIEQAIQGRVAGVSVTSSGGPGESPMVRIRGIGSINYASSPLYVVDGMPIQGLSSGANNFPAIGMTSFDNKDIESVEVLKDASSTAIYGSRAANGVILITTKKGSRDGLHVNVDSYMGTQAAWKKLDLMNTSQYLEYATEMKQNNGAALPGRITNMNQPVYTGATQTFGQTNTDWQDEMFRMAMVSQHQISLSGGNENSRLYSSAGYFKQEGIMLGTGYERVNFRINSDHNVSKRITFGENFFVAFDDKLNENNTLLGGRSQIQHMIRMQPYIPVNNPNNAGGFGGITADDGSDPQNPVRVAMQDKNRSKTLRFLGTGYVDVKLLDFLSYRASVGVDYNTIHTNTMLPIYSEGFNNRNPATLTDNVYTVFSPLFTNQLSFNKTFGKHEISAVVVAEQQGVFANSLQGSGQFTSNDLNELNGANNQSVIGRRAESHLISYLGRLNYAFANKYLLQASFRRDGSSVFAPGKKWGNFPAASVGWRISEEGFIKNSSLPISELKVRASYGLLGFNGVGAYDWQIPIDQDATAVLGNGTTTGSYYDRLGNKNLQWETTKMWNIGLDYGMFNNALTFSVEVYNRLVDNLILGRPVIPSQGFTNPTIENVGQMKNWGYEFQAGYAKNSGDFRWNVSANVGIIKNEVIDLGGSTITYDFGSFSDYASNITRTQEGQPVQSFYGYVTDGIFQTDEEAKNAPKQILPSDMTKYNPQSNTAAGDIKFKDLNKDGVINGDDRTFLGSFLPKFNYGLNLSASYKNFDFTMFLQGVQGNKIFNLTKFYTQASPRLFNGGTALLDAWTPTNPNTDVPRAIDTDPNQNARVSDRFIEDGSYLRIKNLSIGYNIPGNILNTLTNGTVKRFRVYVASQNLLTATKYTGYDPEIGSKPQQTLTSGVDYGQFPAARTIMGGVQFGF